MSLVDLRLMEVGKLVLRRGSLFVLALMFVLNPLGGVASGGEAKELPSVVIDINRATVEEFERLPGFGPKLARQVVAFRERHGPFLRVEDLMVIKGVGFKKWKRIKPYVRVAQDKDPSRLSQGQSSKLKGNQ